MEIQTTRRSLLPVRDAWEARGDGFRAFGKTEDEAVRNLSNFENYRKHKVQEVKPDDR
jgi:hypothetical protein